MEIAEYPPTLSGLQAAFLADQIRILSQPVLHPSSVWRAAYDTADNGLSLDTIENALRRANDAMGQHCRRVYTPQATRAVSERTEDDHVDNADDCNGANNAEALIGMEYGAGWAVGVDANLSDGVVAATLPRVWSVEQERLTAPTDASRYSILAEHLSALVERRTRASSRIEGLKRIKATIRPFGISHTPDDDPTESLETNLQENIITRGCEIERELERMKVLLARVGGRVALFPDGEGFGTTIINRNISWQGCAVSKAEQTNMVLDSV